MDGTTLGERAGATALDRLADIVRRRGVRRIAYFHCDHFEPWRRFPAAGRSRRTPPTCCASPRSPPPIEFVAQADAVLQGAHRRHPPPRPGRRQRVAPGRSFRLHGPQSGAGGDLRRRDGRPARARRPRGAGPRPSRILHLQHRAPGPGGHAPVRRSEGPRPRRRTFRVGPAPSARRHPARDRPAARPLVLRPWPVGAERLRPDGLPHHRRDRDPAAQRLPGRFHLSRRAPERRSGAGDALFRAPLGRAARLHAAGGGAGTGLWQRRRGRETSSSSGPPPSAIAARRSTTTPITSPRLSPSRKPSPRRFSRAPTSPTSTLYFKTHAHSMHINYWRDGRRACLPAPASRGPPAAGDGVRRRRPRRRAASTSSPPAKSTTSSSRPVRRRPAALASPDRPTSSPPPSPRRC